MLRSGCALLLMLAPAAISRADERLVVVPSTDRQPTLLVPKDFLTRNVETERQTAPLFPDAPGPTVLAAVAAAVAFVLLGLYLVRRASARLTAGAAACALAGLLFVNTSCSPGVPINDRNEDRNIRTREGDYLKDRRAPYVNYRPIVGPSRREDGTLQGEVLLEEGAAGDAFRLYLDPDTIEKIGSTRTKP